MSLRRLYGLDEMAINVPDENIEKVRTLIKAAAKQGVLPKEAGSWPGVGDIAGQVAGTPADGVPQTSSEPAKGAKKGKRKAQAAEPAPALVAPTPPPREPIPLDPAAKADIDKSSSAWDQLAQASGAKRAPAANAWKPVDNTVGANDYDLDNQFSYPSFPNSAAAQGQQLPVNTPKPGALSRIFGQKPPEDDAHAVAMQPKQSMLSKMFSKKPKIAGDTEFDVNQPQAPAKPDPKAQADIDKKRDAVVNGDDDPAPEWSPEVGGGEDAIDSIRGDLGASGDDKKKGQKKHSPGADAVSDLNWDVKRSKKGK